MQYPPDTKHERRAAGFRLCRCPDRQGHAGGQALRTPQRCWRRLLAALAFSGTLLPGNGGRAESVPLAHAGRASLPLVLCAGATAAEQTAARELREHLRLITGAEFTLVAAETEHPSGAAAVYLGDTAFARRHGIDAAAWGEEEAAIRTVAGSLILAGGRPRGTLYAVYRFLEDQLGCRWYTPWADTVPAAPALTIPPLDRRLRPAFALRDTYTQLPNPGWSAAQKDEWFAWCARNRLNGPSVWNVSHAVKRLGDYRHAPGPDWGRYGGVAGLRIGGPHTFSWHFPAAEYFAKHPEWYSLRQGKRVPSTGIDGNHLCITNPDLRQAYIEKLKTLMRENPDIRLFSVVMNDGGCTSPCDCPACTAAAAGSSWSDVYLEFINTLAAGIAPEFPRNRIWTLAYSFASEPPATVRARDNVQVMACLLESRKVHINPESFDRHSMLAAWAKKCGDLQVWDYVRWQSPFYSLFPSQYRSAVELRFCRDAGITGVMAENEIWADRVTMVEHFPLRNWIYAKLMEDPDRDPVKLVADYVRGVYGPAGETLLPYFRLQRERLPAWPHAMLDLSAFRELQTAFDAAETTAAPPYQNRVRDARVWADLTGLLFRNRLAAEFVRSGGRPELYPFPARMLADRIGERLAATADPFWQVRYHEPSPGGPLTPLTTMTRAYVRTLAQGNDYAPLPDRFRELPAERVIDIPGYQLSVVANPAAGIVEDPDSVFGVVAARRTDTELPVHVGVYDHTTRSSAIRHWGQSQIAAQHVTGPGYHLYYVGRTLISVRCVFFFTQSWQIGYELDKFHEPQDMTREWDLYVSAKLDGPAYPHGRPDARNGVYIERLILVRAETPPDEPRGTR